MSKRRHFREQPAFPFPFGTNGKKPSASSVVGAELGENIAPVLVQLLAEVESWLAAPVATRRIWTDAPDLDSLPAELATRAERTFELLREALDQHTQDAVALALVWTGDWIEAETRAARAAIVFQQAALLLVPDNVPLPYHIGRLLRRVAMYDEAEAWLLHTVDKAAAADNWQHHALALSGMGNLKRERGNFPESVRFHRLALDSAREHGVRRLEGDALYDLAVMHFERGELDEGMGHAREAINAYGPGHSQLVRMANDLAWIWMHLHGEAGLALTLFQAIEPRVQDPAFRCVLLANITRAAAEVEQEHIYELGWLEAYAYMRKQDTEDGHAAAFGQMALASIASMQLERARQAAGMSLNIAQRRREHRLALMAERILDALEDGLPPPEQMKELFPAFTLEEVEESAADRERNEDFVSAVGIAVKARQDGAPESPVRALICGK